jgi:hypothetical protein
MLYHLETYEAVPPEPVAGDVVSVPVSFGFVGVTGSAMMVDRTVSV